MNSKVHRYGLLAILLFSSSTTWSNTSSVFSPEVKVGDTRLEYRASYVPDDGQQESRLAQRLHIQHALDDSFRLRLIGAQSRMSDESLRYDYTRVELQHQFLEDDVAGWDAALRYELQFADAGDEADRFRLGVSGKWDLAGNWQFRANGLVGRQFGSNATDITLIEIRSQITMPFLQGRIGMEMFNDFNYDKKFVGFNEQDHQLGPLFKGKWQGFSIMGGYLYGLSESSDKHNFRLHVARAIP